MLADGTIAAATLVLALLFIIGYNEIWLLYPILLIRAAGTGIQVPAVNALIPQIVPQDRLMKVNGINSSITSLMMFLSPAAGGAIFSVAPIETVFMVDVATAIIGISLMFTIQVPSLVRKKEAQRSNLYEIKEGLHYVRRRPFIKQLLISLFVVLFLISPSAFLTPLMVSRSFGAEVWRLTASEMTFSAGALLGGVLIATWGGFRNRLRTTLIASAMYGLLMIGLGAAPEFISYLILNFLIGITMPCFNSPITVMLQEKVEPQLHGRVFSLMQVSNSCALPLGMVLFGPLADIVKVETILIYCGLLVLACTLYASLSKRYLVVNE